MRVGRKIHTYTYVGGQNRSRTNGTTSQIYGLTMRVLILRAWEVLPYAATFSTIEQIGVGGTELQLLQHARALQRMGHEVTVFGVTKDDRVEENIIFKGTAGKDHCLELLTHKYKDTHVIFLNIIEDLSRLKAVLPKAIIIETCQNGPHFINDSYIDIYAFVGFGQFAYYSAQFKRYRPKFMMLPNVPLWNTVYSNLTVMSERDQIIWVGSVNKQGFRRWAKAMQVILQRNNTIKWVICVPSYDLVTGGKRPKAFSGINLPYSRIEFKNLLSRDLALEIAQSKIVLSSLGGEDGPVSYLDGHAGGVPVLCGDDIYGKFSNPEGTGLRCTTVRDCINAIEFLLERPELRRQMGKMGRRWIANNFTEDHQYSYMQQIMAYARLKQSYVFPAKTGSQSDKKFPITFWLERLEIKIFNYFHKPESHVQK